MSHCVHEMERSGKEAAFNAVHDGFKAGFGNLIKDLSSFTLSCEETATLQQTQMFGSDVVRHIAMLGQLADGVAAAEQAE